MIALKKINKFIVQAVVVEEDADGNIVGELTSEPTVAYGVRGLREWLEGFGAEIQKINEEE